MSIVNLEFTVFNTQTNSPEEVTNDGGLLFNVDVNEETVDPRERRQINIDGDDDLEDVIVDPRGTGVIVEDNDGDGRPDTVIVGGDTVTPVVIREPVNIDGDKGRGPDGQPNDIEEMEIIIEDPTLPIGFVFPEDLDGDGDIDLIRIGTGGTARIDLIDLDGDGELDIALRDFSLPVGSNGPATGLDGDPDLDFMVVGAGEQNNESEEGQEETEETEEEPLSREDIIGGGDFNDFIFVPDSGEENDGLGIEGM